ncbi:MAG: hypothetical protein IT441_09865, partial [Phycisphaeraceae bacterium]|nr:hypothetical protein [Phycisphaeraceae bacterium]
DRHRFDQVVAIFRTTLAQEAELKAQAEAQAQRAEAERQRQAHLAQVAQGPVTTVEQLELDRQRQERSMLQLERFREEMRALQRQLDLARQVVAAQQEQVKTDRQRLVDEFGKEQALRDDRDFRQAVELYESLRPRQTKEMFRSLIDQRRQEEVVEYLASMQPRKAAAVLKEFKQPEEIRLAADLVEALRSRGVDLLRSARNSSEPTS